MVARQSFETRTKAQIDREVAEEFWATFDIDIEFDTAINARKTLVSPDNGGFGHDAATVIHFAVLGDEHILQKPHEEREFLCRGNGVNPRYGERRQDENGEDYLPEVTCPECIRRMERIWG